MGRARDLANILSSSGNVALDSEMALTLITPTSIATTGGSGSISATGAVSFTSASAISLNDVFSSTYTNYRIVFNCTKSTNCNIGMRLRVSGSDDTSSVYATKWIYVSNTTLGQYEVNTTRFELVNSDTQSQVNTLDLIDPFATATTILIGSSLSGMYATQAQVTTNFARFGATTSFTGFTMIPNAGNITGTVSVYGYRK
jgi:hypothetical protein